MSATSLVARLERLAQSTPDLELYFFLRDGVQVSEVLNCAGLDRRARQIAAMLRESLAPGDRALLLYSSGLEFIAVLFGCFYAGVVAVPCQKPRSTADAEDWKSIARIAADSAPSLVLTDSTDVERRCAETIGPSTRVICTSLIQQVDDSDVDIPATEMSPDTVAFLQYTSGSTGDPKGAVITHGNLVSNLTAMERSFLFVFTVGVTWLPMHHDMGLIGAVCSAVWMGSPLYVMSPFSMLKQPYHWLNAISRFRATISPAPNFAFDYCVQRITNEQKATLDLSCWKVASVGAEPVQERTLRRFYEAFRECGFQWESFYPCYGLAEATLFVSGGQTSASPVIRLNSAPSDSTQTSDSLVGCGQPAKDHQILIVDPATSAPLAERDVGEVWVKGPSVAAGYWNSPSRSSEAFGARTSSGAGPFLRTGDLGFFDSGELFLAGRLKDVILIRGRNHFAVDVERTVSAAHPGLADKLTVAFGRVVDGEEQLVILQELERRELNVTPALLDAIQQAIFDRHGLKAGDIRFVRTGTLPKTTSGKTRRTECRKRYCEGALDILEGPS